MLNLGPHEDIWGAQFDFLSGDRSLHNLRGAEHRAKWGWGSSFRGPTTKRYVDGDDNISKAEQQIIW
jgi:hypothetical protein